MTDLPHWSSVVKDIVLVQPSSAAAESVFSILKLSFGPQQDRSLQDYVQSSIMLLKDKVISLFILMRNSVILVILLFVLMGNSVNL